MIRQIDIENFALFRKTRIGLGPGLNVLSGESGSGKSLALDSLAAALGGRLSQERIGPWGEQARVRLHISLDPADPHWAPLADLGLEPDAVLIIERTAGRDGRSAYRAQGQPVPAQIIRSLGESLIQYVGQNQLLKILNRQYMLDWLDQYAGLEGLAAETKTLYGAYNKCRQDVFELSQLASALSQLDDKRAVRDELHALNIEPGEDDRLSQELARLRAGRTLIETGQALYQRIDGGDGPGLLAGLDQALHLAETLARYDAGVNNVVKVLQDAVRAIGDARLEISAWMDQLDLDPVRLEQLEARADALSRAKRRFGPELSDVIAYLAELNQEISRLENLDWELGRLKAKQNKAWQAAAEIADRLSSARQDALKKAQRELTERIREMEMPTGQIVIERQSQAMTESGVDMFDVLFSASRGQALKPLAKVASGGEIARIALALAVTGPARDDTVYIFDEVDQGLGGASAERVAWLLKRLGRSAQVLAVSHQAVVASRAGWHLAVRKRAVQGTTVSDIEPLGENQRIREVARMLSGSADETALQHAKTLLVEGQGD